MRPIYIELTGFAAFRDRVAVDFRGADFFALVGATGAGKSTIIDAMCFALYGSVPRYGDRRLVRFVISAGALQARVSFTFEVGGKRYIATRIVVRQPGGQTTTKEARLERVIGSEPMDSEVLAGKADDVTRQVTEILGLSFDHFTKCVVLPQGEFARFLHDTPADRQDLLVRLLELDVYERMAHRAREIVSEANGKLKEIEGRLKELAPLGEISRTETAARVKRLGQLRALLDESMSTINDLETVIVGAEKDAVSGRKLLAVLSRVKMPRDVSSMAKERANEAGALGEAQRILKAASAEIDRLKRETVEQPRIVDLRAVQSTHEQLQKLSRDIAADEVDLESMWNAENATDERSRSAKEVLASAQQSYENVRRAHAAHDLATALVPGEPCLVCLQPVDRLPKHRRPPGLQRAERAVQSAQHEVDSAAAALVQATQRRTHVEGRLKALRQQVDAQRKLIARYPDRRKLEALLAQVRRTERDLSDARTRFDAAHKLVEEHRATIAVIDEKLSTARGAYQAQRDALSELKPPADRSELASTWRALEAWAEEQRPVVTARIDEAEVAAKRARDRRDEQIARLIKACSEASITPADGRQVNARALRDATIQAEVDAKNALKVAREAVSTTRRLREDARRTREDGEVAHQLSLLLSANHFERWLVAGALHRLVERASTTLYELSSGQYSLKCDSQGDILVIDHRNADEIRSAKTLSGGETFQASLALALALAQQTTELTAAGGPKLEAFFLDEGFGSLDAESLETVANTLENLGTEGRMVGIVTHVRDFAERVPVRYVVTKGSRTSTVERVDALAVAPLRAGSNPRSRLPSRPVRRGPSPKSPRKRVRQGVTSRVRS